MPVAGTFAAASARGFGFGTEDMFGEQIFSSPGTYTFYVPPGVTSISVVSIGGGGGSARGARYTNFEDPNSITPYTPPGSLTANFYAGGGGGLAYKNSISVTPGQPITVFVGAGGSSSSASDNPGQESYIATAAGTKLVRAGGGNAGTSGAGGTMLLGDGGGLQFRLKKYFVAVAVAAQAATLATAAQVATEQTALQALVAVAAVAAAEGSVRLQRAAGLLNTFMAMELAQEAEQAFLV